MEQALNYPLPQQYTQRETASRSISRKIHRHRRMYEIEPESDSPPRHFPADLTIRKKRKNHAEIKFVDFGSTTTPSYYKLVLHKHEPTTLSLKAVEVFSKPIAQLLPKQQMALVCLQQLINGWEAACKPKSGVPDRQYMKNILRAMGTVYFFDSLYPVKFVWDLGLCTRGMYGCYQRGQVRMYGIITMDPNPIRVPAESRKAHIVGTLLHECCHAFQLKYYCPATCTDPNCQENYRRVQGGGCDHGSAWFILASHVQAVAKQHLGLDVTSGPRIQLKHDWQNLGTYPSSEHRKLCHGSWQDEMNTFVDQVRCEI
jgi:hypothetical protein